jgi:putative transposon-encoded protein
MQKKTLLFFIFIAQFFNGHSQSPYQIKSCKIDFVFSNGLQKGTKTLIFTDSGKVEKVYGVTYVDTSANSEIPKQFIGSRTVYRSLIIQTKDSVFTVDLDLMTGGKRERFNLDMSSLFDDQKKKTGQDTFLNKTCDIVDFQGFKVWYWKGLALKKEMTLSPNQKVYEYATAIDENYIIKDNEFKVPNGVNLK